MNVLAKVRLSMVILSGCALIGGAVAAGEDGSGRESGGSVEVRRVEGLSLDLKLMGTIIRRDSSANRALFTARKGEVEKIYSVGDEISEGVVLRDIERDRVLAEKGEQSYWIGINQSAGSERGTDVRETGSENPDGVVVRNISRDGGLAEESDQDYRTGENQPTASGSPRTSGSPKSRSDIDVPGSTDVFLSTVHPIDRVDSAEFYTSDGVLMEGAAARYYGVDLDAEPVKEIVDLDKRLENLPDGVEMKNGIPATWWNPRNTKYTRK